MANPIQAQTTNKHHKTTHNHHKTAELSDLIPGLPDHVAQHCLSFVNNPSLLYSVCHSWRRLIYSPSFPPFLSLYAVLSLTNDSTNLNSIKICNFDPVSCKWELLPPPPEHPPLRLILRHPSFISRRMPIQSVSASGNLVLLAASTDNFSPALAQPLLFNPITRKWCYGPALSTPRRWCASGVIKDYVYVASGIGSQFSHDVAKSVEKWELFERKRSDRNHFWNWEKVQGLKDGRFSRDGIDAVGWRGKLCMVNAKGDAAKEGIVYDTETDTWNDMPEGMLYGWKGPVAAINEDTMYVVDEKKGALRKYDQFRDEWETLIEDENLKGAQQMAAAGGRVCVVCNGNIVVLDVFVNPVNLRILNVPEGYETVAVHILPRMSKSELKSGID